MGLFNKLKNMVTGGAASVSLEMLDQPSRGGSFKVRVTATAKDDCKIDKVYVMLRGEEEIEVPDTDYGNRNSGGVSIGTGRGTTQELVRKSTNTHEAKIDLANGIALGKGQSQSWEGSVSIPGHVLPTYMGRYAHHEWAVKGGLAMTGNDPDSGWIKFELR